MGRELSWLSLRRPDVVVVVCGLGLSFLGAVRAARAALVDVVLWNGGMAVFPSPPDEEADGDGSKGEDADSDADTDPDFGAGVGRCADGGG